MLQEPIQQDVYLDLLKQDTAYALEDAYNMLSSNIIKFEQILIYIQRTVNMLVRYKHVNFLKFIVFKNTNNITLLLTTATKYNWIEGVQIILQTLAFTPEIIKVCITAINKNYLEIAELIFNKYEISDIYAIHIINAIFNMDQTVKCEQLALKYELVLKHFRHKLDNIINKITRHGNVKYHNKWYGYVLHYKYVTPITLELLHTHTINKDSLFYEWKNAIIEYRLERIHLFEELYKKSKINLGLDIWTYIESFLYITDFKKNVKQTGDNIKHITPKYIQLKLEMENAKKTYEQLKISYDGIEKVFRNAQEEESNALSKYFEL